MKPDDNPDLEPPRSRVANLSGSLKAAFRRSALLGFRLLILATGLFIAYLVLASGLALTESSAAPPGLLSTERDPLFYTLVTIVGVLLIQSSGSLLLFKFLTGLETPRDHFAVLFSFVALGSGGAILRISLPQTLELLLLVR